MRHDSNDGKSLSQRHKLAHQFVVVVRVSVFGVEHQVQLIGLSDLSAGFRSRLAGGEGRVERVKVDYVVVFDDFV